MYDWHGILEAGGEGRQCQLLQNPIHSWRKIIQNRNENWKAGKQKKNIQTQRAKLTFMQKVFCENRWAWISERRRGGGGWKTWRSYAKHRRLLLQNAAVRVIFWHGAHAAGLKNGNSNPNSHLDSHSHSDWDSNCPRKPPTPSWTFQWSRGLSPEVAGAGGVTRTGRGRGRRHLCLPWWASENCFVKISF